jgi:hypothetical protein
VQQIHNLFQNIEFKVSLGSYEEVMVSTSCGLHPPMICCLFERERESLDAIGITSFTAYDSRLGDVSIAVERSGDSGKLYAFDLHLATDHFIKDGISRAVETGAQWIDQSLICRWKDHCDNQQNHRCRQSLVSGPSAPTCPKWLIDTQRLCLTRGDIKDPYIALSYVWGKKPFFQTLRENLSRVRLRRAFSISENKLCLPRTFLDACSVASLLGERYLWINALCIVQDDEETKLREINNMISIYANASVTIIAKDGYSVHYGLRGLQGVSQPRDPI